MDTLTTKICIACGATRPIADFLQANEPNGLGYGNICAPCRNTQLNKYTAPLLEDEEDESAGGLGLRIDSKTIMHHLEQSDKQRKILTELAEEEIKQDEDLALEKQDQLITNEIDKLKIKQKVFLSSSPIIANTQKPPLDQPTNPRAEITKQENNKQQAREAKTLTTEKAQHLEQTLGGDHNAQFRRFEILMGANARSSKMRRQFIAETVSAANKQKSPEKFIDQTWGPEDKPKPSNSSRKR